MIKPSILITGSCSSLGQAISLCFAKSNHLILHGTNREKLERLLNQCPEKENHIPWICDFEMIETVSPSLESLLTDSNLCISGIIHCAGKSPLMHTRLLTPEDVTRLFNINTFSAFAIIASLLKHKSKRKALKRIVFVSSVASIMGVRGFAAYSATKGANDSLMRSLAIELAPEIQCASVLLGPIAQTTSIERFDHDGNQTSINSSVPLGIGNAQDVVGVLEFLFSENSRWITGQSIVVDGGQSINGTLK